MGQAALKSRSHRRYYLNKVLPSSLSFSFQRGAFFHLARLHCRLTGTKISMHAFSVKDVIHIIRDFDERIGLQISIDHILH